MKNSTLLLQCKTLLTSKVFALLFFIALMPSAKLSAQCTFNNAFYINYTPVYDNTQHLANACFWGGDYMTLQVVTGATYVFSACPTSGFDTQITVYNAAGTTVVGYNDDFCGLQSQVTVLATYTGTMNVLVDEYNCISNTGPCQPLYVTASLPAAPILPTCVNTPSLTCPANISLNTGAGTCSATATYTTPVGTSPCDGAATASFNPGAAITDNATTTSVINQNTFVAGGTLGGQISLQSVCLQINHTYVGDLTAKLTSPSGTQITLFHRPGRPTIGTFGCGGDNLNVCIITGTGNRLDATATCGNLPAYSGNYTASSANLTSLNNGGLANGNWTLAVSDSAGGDVGSLVSWSLNFTTNTVTTQTSGLASGSSFPTGTTTNAFKATDGFGNISTCSFDVVVADVGAPTITCPATLNVTTDLGLCTASNVSLGTAATADNCTVATVTNNAPAVFPKGTTVVKWTVTDASGNTATCNQNVVVTDGEAPTLTCPGNVTVNNTPGTCGATGVVLGTPTFTDNCPGATASNDAPASFPVGSTTVTWTVTDAGGNSSSPCTQVVTVTDDEDPTITCPGDVTLSADAGVCSASNVNLGTPNTSDNCGVAGTTNDAPASYNVGSTTVTWTVTDVNGNTATCTQTVTVTDDEDPTITCPGDVTVSADAGVCSASNVNLGTPNTSDNCGVAGTTNDAPASYNVGSTTVTWTVTDVNGNTATCTQTVTVTDDEDPTITCPGDVTVSADAGVCSASNVNLGTPNTSDNCGVAGTTNDAPASYNVGSTTVTWTVTDVNGNSATCTQTVTVDDVEDPTITCSGDVTVSADAGVCSASNVNLGTPTTGDNCGVANTTNDAPVSYNVGTTSVTWTVTDNSGNTSTCTQIVTVTDDEDPTITCPGDVTVSADAGVCSASNVNLGTPNTSDNCGVAGTTNDAPASYNVGSTTVTWTVTDVNGNSATCTQTVTVDDVEDPTITCSGDVTVSADAGVCSASNVNLGTPTTGDNCGVANTTNDAPVSYNVGTTSVTWTVTDNSGNTSTCTQIVTVTDDEDPTITCPGDVTVSADAGVCSASNVNLGTPNTSDNCGVAGTTNDAPASYNVGSTTVTWTVTDVNGNTATCTQTVTVTDDEDPTITCTAQSLSVDPGLCGAASTSLFAPSTADNCGVDTVTNDAPAILPVGVTTVNWTVTDVNGNTAVCAETVTVVDDEDPIITCPSAVSVNSDAGSCDATNVTLGTPTTTDNCGVDTVTNDAPSSFPTGNTTVTWTVTDVNGNTASCTQVVTVVDNIIPTITCPATVSVNADAGSCDATNVILGTPTTADNCGIDTVTNDAPSSFPLGSTTVTWTVSDLNGNTSSCGQTVTVLDAEQPTITCPVDVTTTGCGPTSVALGTPTTADNCSVANVSNDAPVLFPLGTTSVVWTVTDGSGNTATCTQTVTVTGGVDTAITVSGNTYTANAAGATYQWYDCGSNTNVSGATGQSFTPTVSGSYALIVTSGGCTDTSACFPVIVIGINNVVVNAALKVFPNPTSENVNLQVTGTMIGMAKVQLFDVEGRLVRDFVYENMNGTYPISLVNLAADVYELRVTNAQGVWNTKVLKIN